MKLNPQQAPLYVSISLILFPRRSQFTSSHPSTVPVSFPHYSFSGRCKWCCTCDAKVQFHSVNLATLLIFKGTQPDINLRGGFPKHVSAC